MIVSICNANAPFTAEQLKRRYFNAYAPSTTHVTLERYHSTCSFDKLRFKESNNIIVDGIKLPCTGTYNGQTYESGTKCGNAELYGWFDEAFNQVKAMGIQLNKYKRRILMMPRRSSCPWSGLASVGCTSSCNTWINNGGNDIHMPTLFHELGHNIGLMHSNRLVQNKSAEYGDCTDPMGCGGPNSKRPLTTLICMAAPQQWKAGWALPTPDGSLDFKTSFTDGMPITRIIPAAGTTDENMLRIKVADLQPVSMYYTTTPQEHVIYLGYRVRQPDPGFDSALSNDMNQRIIVHTFNATARFPPRPDPSTNTFKPTVIAAMDVKNGMIKALKMQVRPNVRLWFSAINRGINITMTAKDSTKATVSLCTFTKETENTAADCFDSIDNDCNGLIDSEDPACEAFWSR